MIKAPRVPRRWHTLCEARAVVEVWWDDAVTWHDMAGTICDLKFPFGKQHSSGFLIYLDELRLVLAGDYDKEFDSASNISVIPTAWVTKVKKANG